MGELVALLEKNMFKHFHTGKRLNVSEPTNANSINSTYFRHMRVVSFCLMVYQLHGLLNAKSVLVEEQ